MPRTKQLPTLQICDLAGSFGEDAHKEIERERERNGKIEGERERNRKIERGRDEKTEKYQIGFNF